ncbi:hypothetical protein GCM10023096_11920 [Nonomuraea ferruginea]
MRVAGLPQPFFGAEMMLHQADRDTGGIGDGLQRRPLETALGELRQSRVADPRASGQILGRSIIG